MTRALPAAPAPQESTFEQSTRAPEAPAPAMAGGRPAGLAYLDARTGKTPSSTTPPLSRPGIPAWVPSDFDLDAAAKGAADVLRSQGLDEAKIGQGTAERVIFTDADHTLVKTETPVLLADKRTGELVHHPKTGRVLMLRSVGYREHKADLKRAFPQLPWAHIDFDYRQMASIREVQRTPHIQATIDLMREAASDPGSREFIITARSADTVPIAFAQYLAARGLELDGIFPVNSDTLMPKLGLARKDLDTPQRKALNMAALLHLYDPAGTQIEHVRFLEDADSNLRAAMELLPNAFPQIQFEFVDVIHEGGERFRHKTVATANDGVLRDAEGKGMSPTDIARYESDDVPLDNPHLTQRLPDLARPPGSESGPTE